VPFHKKKKKKEAFVPVVGELGDGGLENQQLPTALIGPWKNLVMVVAAAGRWKDGARRTSTKQQ
jgi:hypothetical protein